MEDDQHVEDLKTKDQLDDWDLKESTEVEQFMTKKGTYKFFTMLRKRRPQKLRIDVVYKTLLRDMKKFFISDFNILTNFIKCKRR